MRCAQTLAYPNAPACAHHRLSETVRAKRSRRVTDEDIAMARESGLSEDQIFEIVVCAAIGVVTRQYDTALAALEAATGKE